MLSQRKSMISIYVGRWSIVNIIVYADQGYLHRVDNRDIDTQTVSVMCGERGFMAWRWGGRIQYRI